MPANRAILFELEKLGLDVNKSHSEKALRVARERLDHGKVEEVLVEPESPVTVQKQQELVLVVETTTVTVDTDDKPVEELVLEEGSKDEPKVNKRSNRKR